MIARYLKWAGPPGAMLSGLLVLSLVVSVATYALAGWAAVPFFNILILPLLPFPTLAIYAAAALLVFVLLRGPIGAVTASAAVAQWGAGLLALAIVLGAGFGGAWALNSASGLMSPRAPVMPPAVALPKGAEIALIEAGAGPYVRCGSLCLSLLVQGQASAVEAAEAPREPGPLQTLPGKRFALTPQTRDCLAKQRAYYLKNDTDLAKRREAFIQLGSLPIEYDSCLDVRDVTVAPARQVTLVQWAGKAATKAPGCDAQAAVLRTVVPVEGRPPQIHEARFRGGYRFFEPLAVEPFFGTPDCALPSVARISFKERGFPDVLAPKLWGLLQGGEALGRGASAWLDTVVRPPAWPGA